MKKGNVVQPKGARPVKTTLPMGSVPKGTSMAAAGRLSGARPTKGSLAFQSIGDGSGKNTGQANQPAMTGTTGKKG